MMRFALLPAAAAVLAACASTGVAETIHMEDGRDDGLADLTIEIAVDVPEGNIMLVLFDSQEGYDSGDAIAQASKPAAATVTFTAEGIEPGQYGAKVFHDMNGNGKLDTNIVGMPTEPFAFSNNAPASYGPAKWKDAAFEVSAPVTVHKMEIK